MLAAFLLADIVRPFGSALQTEFLFLGIIAVAVQYPLVYALIGGICFGYIKSLMCGFSPIPEILEISCVAWFIRLPITAGLRKRARTAVAAGALIVHMIFNNYRTTGTWQPMISGLPWVFFIHSMAVFLLVHHIVRTGVGAFNSHHVFFE